MKNLLCMVLLAVCTLQGENRNNSSYWSCSCFLALSSSVVFGLGTVNALSDAYCAWRDLRALDYYFPLYQPSGMVLPQNSIEVVVRIRKLQEGLTADSAKRNISNKESYQGNLKRALVRTAACGTLAIGCGFITYVCFFMINNKSRN